MSVVGATKRETVKHGALLRRDDSCNRRFDHGRTSNNYQFIESDPTDTVVERLENLLSVVFLEQPRSISQKGNLFPRLRSDDT
jgi:hypothetical protein